MDRPEKRSLEPVFTAHLCVSALGHAANRGLHASERWAALSGSANVAVPRAGVASCKATIMESLQGQLLVASPAMSDPNFARTVVAIANHDEDGALGIVLNRPSDTEVIEAVPELEGVVELDEVVYVGGPVQPASIVVLAEFQDPAEAAYLLVERIGLVSDRTGLDRLGTATARRRVYAGYSGWGPGQLEAELEREDWIVEPAMPEDVFDEEPGELWGRVLQRKGGQFRLLARMPIDPSVN
jgi:putative transcriptional regulator